MRLLICAGMTGGGVYPALAVLQTLTEMKAEDVLWIGSEDGMENELITRLGIPFQSIPAAGVHGVGFRKLPKNINQLRSGYQKARKIIQSFKPDVFFTTGGYLSVPVAMAAKNISSIVFIPDVEPGLALKVMIRYADRVLISTVESEKFISNKKKITFCGYPLRKEITKWNKNDARKELGLSNKYPVLFVYGGSKGAQSINKALYPILSDILPAIQVIHISGSENWAETQANAQNLPNPLKMNYHPFSYLHETMGAALAAADLVVCRAGASTLGELPYFNLPAILVPYPYAWHYQKTNADHLEKLGAAVILRDEDMPELLKSTILNLLNNPQRLQSMRDSMKRAYTPNAAEKIAAILCDSAQSRNRKGAAL